MDGKDRMGGNRFQRKFGEVDSGVFMEVTDE